MYVCIYINICIHIYIYVLRLDGRCVQPATATDLRNTSSDTSASYIFVLYVYLYRAINVDICSIGSERTRRAFCAVNPGCGVQPFFLVVCLCV